MSTRLGAGSDTKVAVADSGGSPTREMIESTIHGAEKAVEMMTIYEGAVGAIQLVINVVDPVVGVCTPSPLLSIERSTLAFRLTLMRSWRGAYFP